jgi:hypothetical protein
VFISYNALMKRILLILGFLFVQIGVANEAAHTPSDKDILLSVERVQLQYQRILKQYDFLEDIQQLDNLPNSGEILEHYLLELENHIRNHPTIQKEGAWKKIEHIFQDIKVESRVLARKFGLALSITILFIELTEIPMKAIALGLGSPIVIVLYEVLQPGILIPSMILGIKVWNKYRKSKKYFESKDLFREWKAGEMATSKELHLKRYSTMISLAGNQKTYLIRRGSLFVSVFRSLGLFRKRIDFHSLKRFCKKNKMAMAEMELLKKTNYPRQVKAKILLAILIKDYPNAEKLLAERFTKGMSEIKNNQLPLEFSQWMVDLLRSSDADKTVELLNNFPQSIPPLVFLELWDSAFKEEFYHHNLDFKLKYYRSLEKGLLPLLVKHRKLALLEGSLAPWDEATITELRNYFNYENLIQEVYKDKKQRSEK